MLLLFDYIKIYMMYLVIVVGTVFSETLCHMGYF